jgi:hypothetical protein
MDAKSLTSILLNMAKQEEVAGQIGLFWCTLQNKVFETDIFIVSVENLK